MATRIWSRADVGIWQEDTLVPDSTVPRYIDSSNMTGLTTGLGLTLGPKSNKLLITNSFIRNFFLEEAADTFDAELNFAYGDNGEIYRFDSEDYTPIYTDTDGGGVKGFFEAGGAYFYQTDSGTDLAKATNGDFTSVDETYYTDIEEVSNNVSVITSRGEIYYPNGDQITKFDSDGLYLKDITGFNGKVKAIIPAGGNLYAYTANRVYALSIESDSDTITSESAIGFTVRGSTVKDGITYLVTNDGELKAGNGRQFTNISNPVQSNRLNDNSDYVDKFDFGTSSSVGNTIATAGKDIYVGCNDGTPGIYVYGSIMEGYTKGLHKAITTIHDGTAIDKVYCVAYSDTQNRIYYAYLSGTQYGIDYIDTTSKETAETGYAVTEVFSANTTFIKRAEELRITVEGVSGDNYVKLYQRVNNGSWTLLRNITGETGIVKKEVSKYAKENIEVQFKVECYNESGTTPPIVRELYYLYEVTEK